MYHYYYDFIFFVAAFKELGYFVHKYNKHNIFSEQDVKPCKSTLILMKDLENVLSEIWSHHNY